MKITARIINCESFSKTLIHDCFFFTFLLLFFLLKNIEYNWKKLTQIISAIIYKLEKWNECVCVCACVGIFIQQVTQWHTDFKLTKNVSLLLLRARSKINPSKWINRQKKKSIQSISQSNPTRHCTCYMSSLCKHTRKKL